MTTGVPPPPEPERASRLRWKTCAWIAGPPLALLALLMLSALYGNNPHTMSVPARSSTGAAGPPASPSAPPERPQPAIRYVSVDSLCAIDKEAKLALARAIVDGDTEAMRGLLERGKAIGLRKGTKFDDEVSQKDGFTWGWVKSGRQTGRDCYIPESVLQDRQP